MKQTDDVRTGESVAPQKVVWADQSAYNVTDDVELTDELKAYRNRIAGGFRTLLKAQGFDGYNDDGMFKALKQRPELMETAVNNYYQLKQSQVDPESWAQGLNEYGGEEGFKKIYRDKLEGYLNSQMYAFENVQSAIAKSLIDEANTKGKFWNNTSRFTEDTDIQVNDEQALNNLLLDNQIAFDTVFNNSVEKFEQALVKSNQQSKSNLKYFQPEEYATAYYIWSQGGNEALTAWNNMLDKPDIGPESLVEFEQRFGRELLDGAGNFSTSIKDTLKPIKDNYDHTLNGFTEKLRSGELNLEQGAKDTSWIDFDDYTYDDYGKQYKSSVIEVATQLNDPEAELGFTQRDLEKTIINESQEQKLFTVDDQTEEYAFHYDAASDEAKKAFDILSVLGSTNQNIRILGEGKFAYVPNRRQNVQEVFDESLGLDERRASMDEGFQVSDYGMDMLFGLTKGALNATVLPLAEISMRWIGEHEKAEAVRDIYDASAAVSMVGKGTEMISEMVTTGATMMAGGAGAINLATKSAQAAATFGRMNTVMAMTKALRPTGKVADVLQQSINVGSKAKGFTGFTGRGAVGSMLYDGALYSGKGNAAADITMLGSGLAGQDIEAMHKEQGIVTQFLQNAVVGEILGAGLTMAGKGIVRGRVGISKNASGAVDRLKASRSEMQRPEPIRLGEDVDNLSDQVFDEGVIPPETVSELRMISNMAVQGESAKVVAMTKKLNESLIADNIEEGAIDLALHYKGTLDMMDDLRGRMIDAHVQKGAEPGTAKYDYVVDMVDRQIPNIRRRMAQDILGSIPDEARPEFVRQLRNLHANEGFSVVKKQRVDKNGRIYFDSEMSFEEANMLQYELGGIMQPVGKNKYRFIVDKVDDFTADLIGEMQVNTLSTSRNEAFEKFKSDFGEEPQKYDEDIEAEFEGLYGRTATYGDNASGTVVGIDRDGVSVWNNGSLNMLPWGDFKVGNKKALSPYASYDNTQTEVQKQLKKAQKQQELLEDIVNEQDLTDQLRIVSLIDGSEDINPEKLMETVSAKYNELRRDAINSKESIVGNEQTKQRLLELYKTKEMIKGLAGERKLKKSTLDKRANEDWMRTIEQREAAQIKKEKEIQGRAQQAEDVADNIVSDQSINEIRAEGEQVVPKSLQDKIGMDEANVRMFDDTGINVESLIGQPYSGQKNQHRLNGLHKVIHATGKVPGMVLDKLYKTKVPNQLGEIKRARPGIMYSVRIPTQTRGELPHNVVALVESRLPVDKLTRTVFNEKTGQYEFNHRVAYMGDNVTFDVEAGQLKRFSKQPKKASDLTPGDVFVQDPNGKYFLNVQDPVHNKFLDDATDAEFSINRALENNHDAIRLNDEGQPDSFRILFDQQVLQAKTMNPVSGVVTRRKRVDVTPEVEQKTVKKIPEQKQAVVNDALEKTKAVEKAIEVKKITSPEEIGKKVAAKKIQKRAARRTQVKKNPNVMDRAMRFIQTNDALKTLSAEKYRVFDTYDKPFIVTRNQGNKLSVRSLDVDDSSILFTNRTSFSTRQGKAKYEMSREDFNQIKDESKIIRQEFKKILEYEKDRQKLDTQLKNNQLNQKTYDKQIKKLDQQIAKLRYGKELVDLPVVQEKTLGVNEQNRINKETAEQIQLVSGENYVPSKKKTSPKEDPRDALAKELGFDRDDPILDEMLESGYTPKKQTPTDQAKITSKVNPRDALAKELGFDPDDPILDEMLESGYGESVMRAAKDPEIEAEVIEEIHGDIQKALADAKYYYTTFKKALQQLSDSQQLLNIPQEFRSVMIRGKEFIARPGDTASQVVLEHKQLGKSPEIRTIQLTKVAIPIMTGVMMLDAMSTMFDQELENAQVNEAGFGRGLTGIMRLIMGTINAFSLGSRMLGKNLSKTTKFNLRTLGAVRKPEQIVGLRGELLDYLAAQTKSDIHLQANDQAVFDMLQDADFIKHLDENSEFFNANRIQKAYIKTYGAFRNIADVADEYFKNLENTAKRYNIESAEKLVKLQETMEYERHRLVNNMGSHYDKKKQKPGAFRDYLESLTKDDHQAVVRFLHKEFDADGQVKYTDQRVSRMYEQRPELREYDQAKQQDPDFMDFVASYRAALDESYYRQRGLLQGHEAHMYMATELGKQYEYRGKYNVEGKLPADLFQETLDRFYANKNLTWKQFLDTVKEQNPELSATMREIANDEDMVSLHKMIKNRTKLVNSANKIDGYYPGMVSYQKLQDFHRQTVIQQRNRLMQENPEMSAYRIRQQATMLADEAIMRKYAESNEGAIKNSVMNEQATLDSFIRNYERTVTESRKYAIRQALGKERVSDITIDDLVEAGFVQKVEQQVYTAPDDVKIGQFGQIAKESVVGYKIVEPEIEFRADSRATPSGDTTPFTFWSKDATGGVEAHVRELLGRSKPKVKKTAHYLEDRRNVMVPLEFIEDNLETMTFRFASDVASRSAQVKFGIHDMDDMNREIFDPINREVESKLGKSRLSKMITNRALQSHVAMEKSYDVNSFADDSHQKTVDNIRRFIYSSMSRSIAMYDYAQPLITGSAAIGGKFVRHAMKKVYGDRDVYVNMKRLLHKNRLIDVHITDSLSKNDVRLMETNKSNSKLLDGYERLFSTPLHGHVMYGIDKMMGRTTLDENAMSALLRSDMNTMLQLQGSVMAYGGIHKAANLAQALSRMGNNAMGEFDGKRVTRRNLLDQLSELGVDVGDRKSMQQLMKYADGLNRVLESGGDLSAIESYALRDTMNRVVRKVVNDYSARNRMNRGYKMNAPTKTMQLASSFMSYSTNQRNIIERTFVKADQWMGQTTNLDPNVSFAQVHSAIQEGNVEKLKSFGLNQTDIDNFPTDAMDRIADVMYALPISIASRLSIQAVKTLAGLGVAMAAGQWKYEMNMEDRMERLLALPVDLDDPQNSPTFGDIMDEDDIASLIMAVGMSSIEFASNEYAATGNIGPMHMLVESFMKDGGLSVPISNVASGKIKAGAQLIDNLYNTATGQEDFDPAKLLNVGRAVHPGLQMIPNVQSNN